MIDYNDDTELQHELDKLHDLAKRNVLMKFENWSNNANCEAIQSYSQKLEDYMKVFFFFRDSFYNEF